MNKKITDKFYFLSPFYFVLLHIVLLIGIVALISSVWSHDTAHTIGWFAAVATLIGITFVGLQFTEQQKEHEADLHIYTSWATPVYMSKEKNSSSKDYVLDMPGFGLHIIPVNSGLVPGTYRFFGICKKSDWNIFLRPELKKLKKGKLINTGIFYKKLYYQRNDVISKKSSRELGLDPKAELTGNELVFPLDKGRFETIPAKGVGDIRNLPFFRPPHQDENLSSDNDNAMKDLGIKKKLGLHSFEEETLLVVYLDPDYNAFTKEIKVTPPDSDPSLQAAEGVTN